MVFLVLGSLNLSAAQIMDCLCHKWLDTHDKTSNPIKLIFGVLNYACKNKYPRLRSAFTYIDEEQPSQLDFGKHKFGELFTEKRGEGFQGNISYFTTAIDKIRNIVVFWYNWSSSLVLMSLSLDLILLSLPQ